MRWFSWIFRIFFNGERRCGIRWCGTLLQFLEIFSMEKYDMIWDDVLYLHVQRIEINDLEFLKLFFNGEMCRGMMWFLWIFRIIFQWRKCDVAWGGVTCYLNFQNYFLIEKMMCHVYTLYVSLLFMWFL
jgi:hypothetical protein